MATLRQKAAIQKVMENHGNVSKSMREVGYPETTAKNPKNLTESKAWLEIMEESLPDTKLVERHRELLDKRETIIVRDGKESRVEITDQPHSDVKGALDMAYKLKGAYAPEKSQSINLDVKIDATDPKAKALAEEYEEKLKQSMLE